MRAAAQGAPWVLAHRVKHSYFDCSLGFWGLLILGLQLGAFSRIARKFFSDPNLCCGAWGGSCLGPKCVPSSGVEEAWLFQNIPFCIERCALGLGGGGFDVDLKFMRPSVCLSRVQGSGFRVQGSGLRVQGLGFRV